LERYYRASRPVGSGIEFTVRAAYFIAKLKRAGADEQHRSWCRRTITTFNRCRSASQRAHRNKALGSTPADMAAECHYRSVDEAISKAFDYRTQPRRYQGVYTDVVRQYQRDVNQGAKTWFKKLQAIFDRYQSRRWSAATRVRQGSLSRAWKVHPKAINRAIDLLAFYAPILGDTKLRNYTSGIRIAVRLRFGRASEARTAKSTANARPI
jgi:hypothetical protein